MSITIHGSLERKEKHQLVVKRNSSGSRNLGDSSLGRLTTSERDMPVAEGTRQTASWLVLLLSHPGIRCLEKLADGSIPGKLECHLGSGRDSVQRPSEGLKRLWYSTRVQSPRTDMGPEDSFPEGVRGDQGALEGVEQLKSVSLLCWAIWKI